MIYTADKIRDGELPLPWPEVGWEKPRTVLAKEIQRAHRKMNAAERHRAHRELIRAVHKEFRSRRVA
jgi:hypothetical protein